MKTRWLEIEKLEDDIIRLKEIFYKEHANLYLVLGDKKNLLIDTGIGIFNIEKEVRKISQKPIIVVNTHAHYDHCGGNKFFKKVYIHSSEKANLKNPTKENTLSFLIKSEDFKPSIDVKKYKIESRKKIFSLKNKMKIQIGNFKFYVLHTPGHSSGSICLYEPKKKFLFSGDSIYKGELFYNQPFSNPKLYLKSLQKLYKLRIAKCFPGHNELLDGIQVKKVILNGLNTIQNYLRNNKYTKV